MANLLGIDLGTSGCKALLINENAEVLASVSAPIPSSHPQPLWSEQNPEDWWAAVESCLNQLGSVQIDAIGLTGQMHGATFLDADLNVIRPAILWNDQRTATECAEIDQAVGKDRLREVTGNPPLTGFQLPKILWLRKHEPEAFAQVRHVLLPKDYIRLKLTGVFATDVSDASGTGAFDLRQRNWSTEVIEAVGLTPSLFPEVFESHEITGRTAEGIPVVAGGGDQAAGAVGTGAVESGVVSLSLGTSGVVFTSLDRPEFDAAGRVHTFCHANLGWHAMGVMLSCGGALAWSRDTLAPDLSFDEIGDLASSAPLGSKGALFLPYLAGERTPHNNPTATAAFLGLTLGHGRPEICRAVFEGITMGLLDGFDILRGLMGDAAVSEVRVTSGGSKSRFWMQLIADAFGCPTVSLQIDEGPALGAALLAGVGVGVYGDIRSASQRAVAFGTRYEPSGADYALLQAEFQSAYRRINLQ